MGGGGRTNIPIFLLPLKGKAVVAEGKAAAANRRANVAGMTRARREQTGRRRDGNLTLPLLVGRSRLLFAHRHLRRQQLLVASNHAHPNCCKV